MKRLSPLEDFGSAPEPTAPEPVIDADALRSSYEAGYKAGQDSGVVRAEADVAKGLDDLAQVLQEAGFTYFEAHQHVMNSMRPLLETMLDAVLPDLARTGLTRMTIDEIMRLAERIEAPIELRCAPDSHAQLTELATRNVTFPLEITSSDALSDMQVELRYDKGTSRIDMDQTITKIRRMTSDFFTTTQRGNAQDG